MWQSIFYSLQLSDFVLRESALREINVVLIDNPHNCETLRHQRDWQSWVYPLLKDLPAIYIPVSPCCPFEPGLAIEILTEL